MLYRSIDVTNGQANDRYLHKIKIQWLICVNVSTLFAM